MSEVEGPGVDGELSAPADLRAERVPLSTIVVYAAPVGAVFFSSFLISSFFVKFATDILLIPAAMAGTILLVGQVWDAVNDPPIGHLSDRTRTRWGRRRPWFVASAVPLALCTVALWAPPTSLGPQQTIVWTLVAFLLYRTFYSTFRVPHMALGAELSRGYHDRTRVFAGTQLIENVGLLGAVGAISLVENSSNARAMMADLSLAMAFAILVALLMASYFIREHATHQQPDERGSFEVFGQVLKNPHARWLLLIFFFDQAGLTLVLGSLPFFSDWIVKTPGRSAVYLLSAIVGMMLSVPIWVVVSRRFGKRHVWMVATMARGALLASLLLVGEGDAGLLIAGCLLVGGLSGCSAVIGPSVKADIIDWDAAQSGVRREGAYFATWNFAQKSSGAIGGWILGLTLSLSGYVPTPEFGVQGSSTLMGIRIATGIAPAVLSVLGLLCLWRFKLDEDEYKRSVAPNA